MKLPRIAAVAGCLGALAPVVQADYWTITKYYVVGVTTSLYSTYTDFADTYTATQTVKHGAKVTGTPFSSYTYTYTAVNIKVVSLYLSPGAVAAADLTSTDASYYYTNTDRYAYTIYEQPVVYTAPASCPTPFTVSDSTEIDLPSEATDEVTPVSTSRSVSSDHQGTSYTYVTAYLSSNAVPISINTISDFTYSYYISNCRNPTATGNDYYGPSYSGYSYTSAGGSGSSSGGSSSSGDDYYVCYYYTACTTFAVWVIVIATILPTLFLFGFLENYLWFRRMMLGKGALRFGTISWILMSLWILCFTRTVPSRPPQDQAALRTQWKAMSAGTRWRLWWKWGFRHAYPVELLGPDPRNGGAAAAAAKSAPYAGPMTQTGMPGGQGPPPPPGAPGAATAAAAVPNGQYGGWEGQDKQYQQQQPQQPYVIQGYNGGPPPQAPPEGYQWVPVSMPDQQQQQQQQQQTPHQSWMAPGSYGTPSLHTTAAGDYPSTTSPAPQAVTPVSEAQHSPHPNQMLHTTPGSDQVIHEAPSERYEDSTVHEAPDGTPAATTAPAPAPAQPHTDAPPAAVAAPHPPQGQAAHPGQTNLYE